MLGGSGERGDHNEAIAIGGVHQWFRNCPATSGAGHRQEQHRHIGELPTHLPVICTEFTNHALIEIMQFRHISSFGRRRFPSTSSHSPVHGVNLPEVSYPHGDEEKTMEAPCFRWFLKKYSH